MRRTVRSRTFLVLLALVMLGALGGCASGGSGPGASGPSAPGGGSGSRVGLAGRTFLSTKVVGHDLVPGSRITLRFGVADLGIGAGCNSMGGTYGVDGTALRLHAVGSTDMACDKALMDQDAWVAAFLDGATIALDGDELTLAKGDVRLTLLDRIAADPDRPLVGTRWVVDSLLVGQTASSVPAGIVAALTFSADRVDVETGCNTGAAGAAIGAGTIRFAELVLTKKACGAAAVERAVVAALQGEASYRIEARSLTIRGSAGGLGLRAS